MHGVHIDGSIAEHHLDDATAPGSGAGTCSACQHPMSRARRASAAGPTAITVLHGRSAASWSQTAVSRWFAALCDGDTDAPELG